MKRYLLIALSLVLVFAFCSAVLLVRAIARKSMNTSIMKKASASSVVTQ